MVVQSCRREQSRKGPENTKLSKGRARRVGVFFCYVKPSRKVLKGISPVGATHLGKQRGSATDHLVKRMNYLDVTFLGFVDHLVGAHPIVEIVVLPHRLLSISCVFVIVAFCLKLREHKKSNDARAAVQSRHSEILRTMTIYVLK